MTALELAVINYWIGVVVLWLVWESLIFMTIAHMYRRARDRSMERIGRLMMKAHFERMRQAGLMAKKKTGW